MAGDWIKMRPSLLTNPKVNGIARFLENDRAVSEVLSTGFRGVMSEIVTRNVMRHVTVSSLLVIWGAANEHTRNGVFSNADLSDLDDMVGIPGFGEAMVSVGWAIYDEEQNSITLPNFEEYNTSLNERSAKAKSAAERQKEYRERKKSQESDVTRDVTRDVTSDVTRNRREEKRREDIKDIPHTPQAGRNRGAIALQTYLDECKKTGSKPIPEGHPVFDYADKAGIPADFLRLQWLEFKARYIAPDSKRYKAWPTVFDKSVRGNWFRLWYAKDGGYALTTTGEQARQVHREAA